MADPGWFLNDAIKAAGRVRPDPDLAYLANSASIVAISLDGVRLTLSEGSKCLRAESRRGAKADALRLAQAARDRLDTLIEQIGGE